MAAVPIISMVRAGAGGTSRDVEADCRNHRCLAPPHVPSCTASLGFCSHSALRPLSPCKVHQPHTLPTCSPGNGVLELLSKPWECSLRWTPATQGKGRKGRKKGPWLPWRPEPFLQQLRSWGERKSRNTWILSFPMRAKSGKRNGFLHSLPWLLQARWGRRVGSS